jgi:hypothetical protein
MRQDGVGRVGDAYGTNDERLVEFEKQYDAENRFRLNVRESSERTVAVRVAQLSSGTSVVKPPNCHICIPPR